MHERRPAGIAVYPVVVKIFGLLVDGEGDCSDDRDASEWRRDTLMDSRYKSATRFLEVAARAGPVSTDLARSRPGALYGRCV